MAERKCEDIKYLDACVTQLSAICFPSSWSIAFPTLILYAIIPCAGWPKDRLPFVGQRRQLTEMAPHRQQSHG